MARVYNTSTAHYLTLHLLPMGPFTWSHSSSFSRSPAELEQNGMVVTFVTSVLVSIIFLILAEDCGELIMTLWAAGCKQTCYHLHQATFDSSIIFRYRKKTLAAMHYLHSAQHFSLPPIKQ